jgi:membrane protein implicated in regulation of membrane protease activity
MNPFMFSFVGLGALIIAMGVFTVREIRDPKAQQQAFVALLIAAVLVLLGASFVSKSDKTPGKHPGISIVDAFER